MARFAEAMRSMRPAGVWRTPTIRRFASGALEGWPGRQWPGGSRRPCLTWNLRKASRMRNGCVHESLRRPRGELDARSAQAITAACKTFLDLKRGGELEKRIGALEAERNV